MRTKHKNRRVSSCNIKKDNNMNTINETHFSYEVENPALIEVLTNYTAQAEGESMMAWADRTIEVIEAQRAKVSEAMKKGWHEESDYDAFVDRTVKHLALIHLWFDGTWLLCSCNSGIDTPHPSVKKVKCGSCGTVMHYMPKLKSNPALALR